MNVIVQERGQAVIPARLLERVGIAAGDSLNVTIDPEEKTLRLAKVGASKAEQLAGSLSKYAKKKKFPTKKQMEKIMGEAFVHESHYH
ncbi:MAG: AbrB/MazE/SpoVT family DNA-binding domain-containing protein [Candidatus Sumerlaeota bacterium]|nr:AbrB/MazE/SpoVT family DNA-binding domain-containing protein [Candidatus Sumerlaeota bacterium]